MKKQIKYTKNAIAELKSCQKHKPGGLIKEKAGHKK